MKKLITAICIAAGLTVSAAFANTTSNQVDANAAIATFAKDLQNIRSGLDKGTMQPNQALVLLSAIEARQNQVLIAQNAEIIQLLQAGQKPTGAVK